MTAHQAALEALTRYFGYDSFRPGQQGIVEALLAGRDVLGVMPTGAGKSVCYQIPAALSPGVTLVISPLISLMRDQVDALNDLGLPAAFINTTQTPDEQAMVFAQAAAGQIKLLYVAPERLETGRFRDFAARTPISLIAVDEAHCVSQWGQDFRSSYLGIGDFIAGLPQRPPVGAFTATATERVRRDIVGLLGLRNPAVTVTGFDRPNLYFDVVKLETKYKAAWVARYVADHPDESGIVYCATRKTTEALTDTLNQMGHPAVAYHGGMSPGAREAAQRDFTTDKVPVVVATNAFGMGIDKSNVRYVIHHNLPESIEAYYQEAGRAGRDSQRAYALLLVASDDSDRIARRFEQEFPPLEKIKDIYERVCSYLQVGIGDGAQASFLFNIHDFCAREHLYSGTVVSALKLLQQNGYMTLTDAQENPARIMFCVSRDDLYKLRVQRDELDHFIRTLLRLYNGVFTEFRQIDEGEIATWSGYTVQRVKELLKRLWQLRVIRYVPSNRSPILFMDEERLPRADLYIAPETYKRRQELMRERFEHMLAYAANETRCRSAVLEGYFGEGAPAACGVCDICLAHKRAGKRQAQDGAAPSSDGGLREKLLQRLSRGAADPHELAAEFPGEAQQIGRALRELLDEGIAGTGRDGKIGLK